jgi:hypothetical protein
MRAAGELGEVQTVPAADVEDALVSAQLGEVERPRRRAHRRRLEAVDRLAGREVRVGSVLNAGEISPVDKPVGHSSQTTLP